MSFYTWIDKSIDDSGFIDHHLINSNCDCLDNQSIALEKQQQQEQQPSIEIVSIWLILYLI